MELFLDKGIIMEQIIEKTRQFVYDLSVNESSGHDYEHVKRVYDLALKLHQVEGGDYFIISMVALLHDVDDHKFSSNYQRTLEHLTSLNLDDTQIETIIEAIKRISYKQGLNEPCNSLEAMIVQDADRLDAIGAIGIARTFAYGGHTNQVLQKSIEHFDDKLLKLKDLLNTKEAQRIGLIRHEFMLTYLAQLNSEL